MGNKDKQFFLIFKTY